MSNDDIYEVSIRSLNKSYGRASVFKNLNINFLKDKITAVLGPSGCGKTTLLNIISGIEKDYSGQVYLRSSRLSYVFQEDRLIPHFTVYENVAFVLKSVMSKGEIEATVNSFLNMVELSDCRDKLPAELSGGMKRRVALARAFAYKSDLLLMDEPFKGLDNRLKGEIIQKFLLLYRKDRRTVIMVTHDKEEARELGDVIYSLE
ncbi:ABC transporter ATP-binding protein [Clostridium luticellarii]|jgi:NitT/TauT family transport system ATP-binding protein|uniref:Sulfate/thiosulfate import ATP-binding protein CysA n=1 Tax=Clostridium luticellarii TaxID=1691940 RepID=A0A2T0BN47_9CLOT|nr:ATP-binding cassette domain-containing protein [Clostridium luticellarii]MCI1945672.1 ATP-binding cassette domain-containing protein [Clostridium luticellarii]MCI1967428.1 ATP-binding cassette domain-containing protein [Clostridium luticellarii]MCI1996306.1 ATP-binding cassette domain-containing protein [Clostridium luticellarii]MCI2039789.1 ATP-binding cassette domain-containing protein [Clostridium luticellarii]PRR85308.1 Sulfate/thiosulfate import ATP-binding protein CysA [Clostridium lu